MQIATYSFAAAPASWVFFIYILTMGTISCISKQEGKISCILKLEGTKNNISKIEGTISYIETRRHNQLYFKTISYISKLERKISV